MSGPPRRALGWATVCLLALAGCRASTPLPSPLPAGPQVVEVALDDYRFDYDPAITAGRVVFRVHNKGEAAHSLTLIPLTDDIPPIAEQLRGEQRRAITPLATIKARPPGTATSFAVDLAAGGRYALVCFLSDVEGQPHFRRGMSSEFRVGSDRSAARPPTASPE